MLRKCSSARCRPMPAYDVQITAEPTGRLGMNVMLILTSTPSGAMTYAEDDLPVSRCEWVRLVARQALSFWTMISERLDRSLPPAAIRRDRPISTVLIRF